MKGLALAFAAVLMMVTVASAQSVSFMVADVPFTFHVRNHDVSADTYRISYQGVNNGYLVLTNKKGAGIVIPVIPEKPMSRSTFPKLVFHRYGEEYFLAAILMPDHTLQKLPLSSREKVTHRLIANGQPEEVTVLAQLNK